MIDDYKSKGEWKIQLTMRMIFVSFTDANKAREMHTKSANITIMIGIKTEDIINELFHTFRKRYQEGLETKMKGSSFRFERIDLLEYHLHKISLNRGSSYIKSSTWIKNKGVTKNNKNTKNDMCFQYAITAGLNHRNIDHHPEKISKLRPFINNYNWNDIEYPSHSKDWRKFECNNKTIALNILYVPYNTKQITQTYISKYNNERDNRVNLLMITDGTSNWHCLAVKSISGLLRGITSRHNGDFYCLNCFHTYTTEKKLRKHGKICSGYDFYHLKMPNEDNKILKYIPGEKLLRVPFIIYADLECLLRKTNTCLNNLDKSYTEKKATHRPSGYSLVTCCSLDKSKNERKYYRGEDGMKIFGKDLKDQATKIIKSEKKEMIPLTDEEKETHENQKTCYICEKEFFTDKNSKEFRKMQKVRNYCHYTGKYRGAAHSNCNLNYKILKEIPVVFHNGSTHDYHFIIKQLAREFKGNFECLGENTEKHNTFSIPIKKEHSNAKTATYKLKFIDSCRFMQDSLSNIVNNLFEINNKEPKDNFDDTMRSMTDSLSQSIDKVSEIDREIRQIDKKEPNNKLIDSM